MAAMHYNTENYTKYGSFKINKKINFTKILEFSADWHPV